MMMITSDSDDAASGDYSPSPAVADDISTLSNVMSFRSHKTRFVLDSLEHVVFRSHDPIIDNLLLSKMSGTHDADLIRTTAREWQDNIIGNILTYITDLIFQDPAFVDNKQIRQMFSDNLHFGKTNDPDDGSRIHHDFEQSEGLLIIWVRHTLFFPVDFKDTQDWTTVQTQEQVSPARQVRQVRLASSRALAATSHPFPQDMTSSLSPGRPGDNDESTPAPDSPPVDALITAESVFTVPSTLAATTTSIHTSDVMERLTDLNISFDDTILERLFNPNFSIDVDAVIKNENKTNWCDNTLTSLKRAIVHDFLENTQSSEDENIKKLLFNKIQIHDSSLDSITTSLRNSGGLTNAIKRQLRQNPERDFANFNVFFALTFPDDFDGTNFDNVTANDVSSLSLAYGTLLRTILLLVWVGLGLLLAGFCQRLIGRVIRFMLRDYLAGNLFLVPLVLRAVFR
jgi:hypothetical protein